MKTLFVFNHPAPYKVHVFNKLSELTDIQVVFERKRAKDRPDSFYSANKYNFPVVFLKHGAFSNENTMTAELKKFIKKNHQEYDLIVMNGYSTIAEMRTIRYLIRHKIPYILQINGGVIKKDKGWKRKLKTYFISHAYKYLSPCEDADEYLLHYGARKEDIYHYPYGNYFNDEIIKTIVDQKRKEEIRQKWNLPKGKIFINASQFIERKNNMQLISIFKNRKESLVLVGSGKEKEKYQSVIEKENLKNIYLMDYLNKEDLFELLQGCDYFITLSYEDIFGHTTLEAMANGLPVISSNRVISSKDIIENGKNGFLVDITNENDIINAIESIDSCSSKEAIETAKANTIEKSSERINEILKAINK